MGIEQNCAARYLHTILEEDRVKGVLFSVFRGFLFMTFFEVRGLHASITELFKSCRKPRGYSHGELTTFESMAAHLVNLF